MVTRYKVGVFEIGGIEEGVPVEIPLDAENVYFNESGWISDNTKDAISEAKSDAIALPRFPIICVWNGSVSNGDWITYSNLTPDARLVVPKKSTLKEITYSNSNTSVDFTLRLRQNGRTSTPFDTIVVSNGGAYDYFEDGVDYDSVTFNAGDIIDIDYVDQGTNVVDFVLVLFFQAVE